MSDDLQRYRPEYPGFMMPDPDGVWVDRRDVADRIEELKATLLATCKREAATQARHDAKVTALEARADALAEKLERAVEALREAETAPEPDHHVPQFRHVMDVIGATLAQITEQRSCDALRAKGGKTDG